MAMERGDLYLLENFENDLLETLAVDTLLPHLRKNKLLTPNEMDSLTKSGISRREAARELLRILKTKGSGSFSLFIDALRMEKEHMGHQSLYKAITTYCQTEEAETLQAESVISFPQDEKSLQYQLGETLVKPKGAMISTPHPIGTDVVGSLPLCMWSQKSSSSSSITSSSLPHSPLHSSSNNLHGMFMSKLLDIEGHLRSNSRHIVEIKDIMKSTASIHEGINHDAKYVDKRRASIDSGEVSKISEPSMEKSRISNTSLKRPLEKSATCPSLSRMVGSVYH